MNALRRTRRRARRLHAALWATWLVALGASILAVPHEAGAEGTAEVHIVDFMRFEPAELTVPVGTTVTWVNHDGSNHIVEFSDRKSPRLRHDASYSRRFDAPGEYAYVCSIHGARMSGKIIVR